VFVGPPGDKGEQGIPVSTYNVPLLVIVILCAPVYGLGFRRKYTNNLKKSDGDRRTGFYVKLRMLGVRYSLFEPIVLLHTMIGYWHHHVVRLSVCLSVCINAVHCDSQSQGWCTGPKVVAACS